MTWITLLETLHHDVKTENADDCIIKKRQHFSFYLFWHFKNRWGVRAEWISVAARLKKKLTSQTEERIDFDRSQPSFIGTYEGENKGWKRRMREWGGFKVGDGAAEPTNGAKTHINLRGYTWDPVSQATTHNQAEQKEGVCVCEGRMKQRGYSMKRCIPPFFGKAVLLGTVCLSS